MNSLNRCLNPRSIAVVGGLFASRAIRECKKLGFAGELWAVNPRRESMEGQPCYPDLKSLPGVPDATLVAVSAQASIEVVSQLSAMGAGGAVCYAAGFSEAGEDSRQRHLLEAAGSMPVMGPNCYGFVNTLNGAALWPDWHGLSRVESGVAIIAGSGNLAINISMQDRSLPIALLATVGNQAMVGIEHLMAACIDDERITAIGIHMEGLRHLSLFVEMASRAAAVGKPVIVLKTGRSEAGARIALSHTATLAGSADLYDAMFSRLGVGQVRDLETFLEALKLLSVTGPLAGGKIASMSCSGGEAALIADLAHNTCLEFPDITAGQRAELKETLNDYVAIGNPLDYHTFIWGDGDRLRQTFTAMLRPGYDLALLLLDYPAFEVGDLDEWAITGEAFADACEQTGQAGAVVCCLGENMSAAVREQFLARSVVPLLGLQQAVSAIAVCAGLGKFDLPLPSLPDAPAATPPSRHSISEHAAKDLLAGFGIATTGARLASSVEEAEQAAGVIGYPVVLKASVEGLMHKTEVGGVALDITGPALLREHGQRLLDLGGELLVEKMIAPGVAELLLGVAYDDQFGHYMVLGCGGTLVELIADRILLLLPASDAQIRSALGRLRMAKVLLGYRGNPPADVDAVVACVQGLSALVEQQRDSLLEVDINPLIVGEQGSGAIVADALIVYRNNNQGE
jgi:acyl-CoA synthetase (NDP forming)